MDNRQIKNQAFSYGDFVWWFGVVENRHDKMQLGRCQVRVFGYHSDQLSDIPSSDLHWMYPVQGITSAAMNGIGDSPTGLVEGSVVFGFFRDGANAQDGIILGSVGGIPSNSANTSKGFSDPYGTYPRLNHINEPDTNRLAINANISQTSIRMQRDSEDKAVDIALGGTWDEKTTPYDARYPYNHVRETESGHVNEWDDSPGHERIREYHRSGTFYEVHPDGTKVTRIVGDDYLIVARDNNVHVNGNVNITVDGDSNIYTKGNLNMQTDGNVKHQIGGNLNLSVGGKFSMSTGGTWSVDAGSHAHINAPRIDLN